eukprot:365983-Chlamydomonas_euryale.AAC.7
MHSSELDTRKRLAHSAFRYSAQGPSPAHRGTKGWDAALMHVPLHATTCRHGSALHNAHGAAPAAPYMCSGPPLTG